MVFLYQSAYIVRIHVNFSTAPDMQRSICSNDSCGDYPANFVAAQSTSAVASAVYSDVFNASVVVATTPAAITVAADAAPVSFSDSFFVFPYLFHLCFFHCCHCCRYYY